MTAQRPPFCAGWCPPDHTPYPNTDARRVYMRDYMRERRADSEHHERMSGDELRAYKRDRMRVYREQAKCSP